MKIVSSRRMIKREKGYPQSDSNLTSKKFPNRHKKKVQCTVINKR